MALGVGLAEHKAVSENWAKAGHGTGNKAADDTTNGSGDRARGWVSLG